MKKIKVCVLVLILFSLTAIPTFAVFDLRPSFSVYGGGDFCFPTSEYLSQYPSSTEVKMPAFRTSGSFGLDLKVLELHVGNENGTFSFGAGLSYLNVSKSLAYGASQLRPYSGYGAYLEAGIATENIGLTTLVRLLSCKFPTVNQAFVTYELEAVAAFRLVSFKICSLYLIAPVTFSIKADTSTLRLSLGLKIDCSLKKSIDNWRQK